MRSAKRREGNYLFLFKCHTTSLFHGTTGYISVPNNIAAMLSKDISGFKRWNKFIIDTQKRGFTTI